MQVLGMVLGNDLDRCRNAGRVGEQRREVVGSGEAGGRRLGRQDRAGRGASGAVLHLPAEPRDLVTQLIGSFPAPLGTRFLAEIEEALAPRQAGTHRDA